MEITELASDEVVTVYLDESILEVAETLREAQVGSAVVLDTKGDVLGVVTDRDLVVYGQQFVDSLATTTVNDILSMGVVSVGPDEEVLELTELMREEGVRRVPVVEDGDILGIVTLDDVVVGLAEELESPELENLAAVIEAASPQERGDPEPEGEAPVDR
ncbi:MAG: CBS domain-containing protein [Haloarculaceae archaeon]